MLNILAVLCPPVAVALVGRPSQAVANLALTALLVLPGIIHAFAVLHENRVQRRNETLMSIAARYYA